MASVASLTRRVRSSAVSEAKHAPKKVFPGHWSFLLGELAMLAFVVLVLSGIYLAIFYDASGETVIYDGSYEPLVGTEVNRAYASVMDITYDTPGGLVIRQVHHWSALVFLAAITLHAARVFFTGAFRRPRRLNWCFGLTLLALSMAAGFFGLGMPHDLLGGTGSRIGHAFAVSIPGIGPGVAELIFGGEFGNPQMLHRFWLLHVIILPIAIGGLLGAHLLLVWLQTHTQFSDRRRSEDNVVGSAAWPGYLMKTAGLGGLVIGTLVALGALVQIAPIWLYGPFDPTSATVPAQPDWYLGWVEGALRIVPGFDVTLFGYEIPNAFFQGILLPSLIFALLFAWPLLEERVTGDRDVHHTLDRPRDRPVRTAIGVGGLTALVVLWMAASHDLQALLFWVSVDSMTTAYRLLLIGAPISTAAFAYTCCRSLVRGEVEQLGQPWRPDPGDGTGTSGAPAGDDDGDGTAGDRAGDSSLDPAVFAEEHGS